MNGTVRSEYAETERSCYAVSIPNATLATAHTIRYFIYRDLYLAVDVNMHRDTQGLRLGGSGQIM